MDTKLRSEVATAVLRSSTHFNLLIVKITFKRLRLQVSTLLLLIINTLALVLVRVLALTPGGGGYSHTLPIRVCAAQRGRDFEATDLKRGIHFRGVF